ncbi:MAG: SMI1/KNR4 family protein [Thermostichus sp. HHBFW_bins_43]
MTEVDIRRIEAEIGHNLPENYIEFLINHGGSRFDEGNVVATALNDEKKEFYLRVFFGHMPGYGYDLLDAWKTYKEGVCGYHGQS